MSSSNQQRFIPQEMAAKLKAARASRAMQGERRVVTILFCDVTGSTAMAEQLDPEDWAEIMDDAFDYLIAPIYRYEGTLARLMGDAILAFFGAPLAHEDDPERAIRAGLDIIEGMQPFREQVRQRYNLDFNVRIGINTGTVVVGEIGSDLAIEYTAMGDAVNLASRMEQTAQPGTVQISANTHRFVAPLFEFESLGEIDVKGKSAPVQAYCVLAPKEQPGRLRGIAGLSSPVIGRERELEQLEECLTELRQGRGGISLLLGEAGLGKSRLIEELRSRWEADEPKGFWTVLEGISYETRRPYGPFVRHQRRYFGIQEDDDRETIGAKIKSQLHTLAEGEDLEIAGTIELLRAAASGGERAALEGETLKKRLFSAQQDSWRLLAEHAPLVMVFDDLHWADPASVELLLHLFRLCERVPILFLCAMRPYRDSPGWQVKLAADTEYPHRYRQVELSPLSAEASDSLVENLLAIDDLPMDMRASILRKTEGNPFFIEEVIRTLIDRGAIERDESGLRWQAAEQLTSFPIPDNLHALLTARIDVLEDEPRRTLQVASVIGRDFYYRVLENLSGAQNELPEKLNTLQRAGLIVETARQPELEYAFRHELTRDAAYRSILRRDRRRYHRQVGETIEEFFSESLEELAHRLAYHFQEAGEPARAFQYALMAGDEAARLYANTEAIDHYRQALELAQQVEVEGQQLLHLYTRLGRTYELSSKYDQAFEVYAELEALGVERSEPELELAAILPQATIYATPTSHQNPQLGRELSKRARELAQQVGDPAAEARSLWNLMNANYFEFQDLEDVHRLGEEALDIARSHNLKEELAYILHDLGRAYLEAGRVDDARSTVDEAQSIWRELNNLPMLADSYGNLAESLYLAAEFDNALESAQEGLRISRSIDNLWGQAYNSLQFCGVYAEYGHITDFFEVADRCIELSRKAGFMYPLLVTPLMKGWIYLLLGDVSAGEACYQSAISAADEVETTFNQAFGVHLPVYEAYLAYVKEDMERTDRIMAEIEEHELLERTVTMFPIMLSLLGEIALERGQLQRAQKYTRRTLKLLQGAGLGIFVPDLLSLRGRVHLVEGETETGFRDLLEALEEARQQGSRRALYPILSTLTRLEAERGDHEAAQAYAREGRQVVEYIADHLPTLELRASFLNRPEVRILLTGG